MKTDCKYHEKRSLVEIEIMTLVKCKFVFAAVYETQNGLLGNRCNFSIQHVHNKQFMLQNLKYRLNIIKTE